MLDMRSLRNYETLGKNCPIKILTSQLKKVDSESTMGGD